MVKKKRKLKRDKKKFEFVDTCTNGVIAVYCGEEAYGGILFEARFGMSVKDFSALVAWVNAK